MTLTGAAGPRRYLGRAALVSIVVGALVIVVTAGHSWQNAPRPPIRSAPIDASVTDLRRRDLLVPVGGVTRRELRDTFADLRDRTRAHEALDIFAPRGTPVIAVEAGTIEKFFTSVRGGLTIYQFDPGREYAYYYAHLDRYASGLKEHDRVARGQIIGFVGTTGNAPKDTPHLHFVIFRLTDKKQWWQGTPVNPFQVWRLQG